MRAEAVRIRSSGSPKRFRLGRREDAGGNDRAGGGCTRLAFAADDLLDHHLEEIGRHCPDNADEQGNDGVGGGAGDDRVRLPQPEAGQGDEQAQRQRSHPKAEQQDNDEVEEEVLPGHILRDLRQEDEGAGDEKQTGGKAERGPFDLLALDPRLEPAIAEHLRADDEQ